MTANPEQTDAEGYDALVKQLRALARCEHSDFSLGEEAADVISILRADLAEVLDLADDMQRQRDEARRQLGERPAGRVVWRGNTADWFAEMDATDSLVAVPVPPGTEVAVVVLAAGGAQSGEGE